MASTIALAYASVRGGLIAAPYVVVMLYDAYGIGGVVLVLSGMYLALAAIIAVFGIETNQHSLEALAPGLVSGVVREDRV